MRTIAEGLLFRAAATTELWVLNSASDVAIGIDKLNCSSDANRSALRIYEGLHLINVGFVAHGYGLIEIVAQRLRTRWVTKLRHRL